MFSVMFSVMSKSFMSATLVLIIVSGNDHIMKNSLEDRIGISNVYLDSQAPFFSP